MDETGAAIAAAVRTPAWIRNACRDVIKACRRILGPEHEPMSLPVRIIRRIFGNYLLVTADGKPFVVDLRDAVVSYGILADDIWERETTTLFKMLLRPGDVAIDVGANIGYFSVLFALLVGSSGRVLAFEPDEASLRLLQENCKLNGVENVVATVRAAAGARESVAVLHGSTASSVSNRGGHRIAHHAPATGPADTSVRVVDVDAYARAFASVSAIKVDVEGYEAQALAGMGGLLDRVPGVALVMEFWPRAIRENGDDPHAFLDRLAGRGLSFWRIGGSHLVRAVLAGDLLQELPGDNDQADLLCMRPDEFRRRLPALGEQCAPC